MKKVKIERLVNEGHGLGYLDGKVIFIPYSVPGDELSVDNISRKRGVQWGRIKSILQPSPHRIEPFCQWYATCGGCQWQHIDYHFQLKHKQLIVEDTLKRLGKLENIDVKPCIPSPKQQGYRNRVKLHWEEKVGFGFFKKHSRTVIPITSCPILAEEMDGYLKKLSSSFLAEPNRKSAQINMIKGSNTPVCFAMTLKVADNDSLWIDSLKIFGKNYVEVSIKNKIFQVSNGAFFQANKSLLPTMVEHISETNDVGGLGVELYAGVGIFSTFMSSKFDNLVAIEWNRQAVSDAKANFIKNNVNNAAIYPLSAEDGLSMLIKKNKKPNFILVDPPRDGLSKDVCEKIQKLLPKQITYVSCDPATLARDLKKITSTGIYKINQIQPLDMFPHTSHVETIVRLQST